MGIQEVSKQAPPPPKDQQAPYGPAAGKAPTERRTITFSVPSRRGDRSSGDDPPPQRRKSKSPAPTLRPRVVPINVGAVYLGRGRSHVYDLLARGEIEAINSGGRTLLILDSLDAYLDRCPPVQVRPAHSQKEEVM